MIIIPIFLVGPLNPSEVTMSELETLAAAIELERITIKICHLLQSQIDDCKQEAKEEMSKAA